MCVCVCLLASICLLDLTFALLSVNLLNTGKDPSTSEHGMNYTHTFSLSLSLAHSLTHSLTHLLTCTLTCTCCAALFRPTAIVQSELPEDASQAARTQMYNERYVCHISLPPPPFSPSLHHASTSHLTTSPLSLCP